MIFSGIIAESQLGWMWIFYFYSGAGIVLAALFAVLEVDSPANHKNISVEERRYIESSNSVNKNKKIPTPWRAILTSLPVWAIFVSCCAQTWGTFTLLTEIPSFLSNVMNFDIHSDGEISSLPYLVHFFMNFITSPIADKLIEKKILSVTIARKIFTVLGTILPGCALFALGFVNSTHRDLAIVLLIVAVGATSFTSCGTLVNMLDLSLNHAGTLMGLLNGFAQVSSILGPLSVGFLGNDKKDLMLWRKVFWIAAGIYWVCGLFFVVFSTGKLQAWNDNERDEDRTEKSKKKVEL